MAPKSSALSLLVIPMDVYSGGKMHHLIKKQYVVSIFSALIMMTSATMAQGYLVPGDNHNIGGLPADGWQPPCDNPYDSQCQGGGHDQPDYNNDETKTVYLGRTVRNERLSLRQLTGIDSRYAGWTLVGVRARTTPNSPSTTIVQLVAGGRIVASQTNPGYQISLYPSARLVLGGNTQDVLLTVQGQTYIESLEVELRRDGGGHNPGYPPNQPPHFPPPPHQPPAPDYPGYGQERVELSIYRSTYGNDRIDLTQYIDTYRYHGRRIEQVIVKGYAQNNVALADLLINGFNAGTLQFDRYSTRQSVWLSQRPDIGGSAGSLVLYTRGNMVVETVILVLSGY